MQAQHYYYNCSREYVDKIDALLFDEVSNSLHCLGKRATQAEINRDLMIELAERGWAFDSAPADMSSSKKFNNRQLCLTSSTLNTGWHSDFAKVFGSELVQLEVQFGKVEAMFKDFCGFRIAYFERRLALGIEVVMDEPNKYFAHRKSAVSGMAYFDIAQRTLLAIGLVCPIWLIGISA